METKKSLTVTEIHELQLLLGGAIARMPDGRQQTLYPGFTNERHISEGTRRIATRVLKKLQEAYPDKRLQEIDGMTVKEVKTDLPENGELPPDYKPTPEELKALAEKIDSLRKELLESKVEISFDELPDWTMMNSRLEDTKTNLSHNYSYLFEKLFLNY